MVTGGLKGLIIPALFHLGCKIIGWGLSAFYCPAFPFSRLNLIVNLAQLLPFVRAE